LAHEWNLYYNCHAASGAQTTCPIAPHSYKPNIPKPDGTVYLDNDDGIYAKPLNSPPNANGNGTDWKSLNSNLRTLQYYGVGVGKVDGGVAVSGGLQDNGTSLLLPGTATMVSNAGGDGGKIIVDPDDGCNILTEYPAHDLWLVSNCGRSDGTVHAINDVAPPEHGARFIAPIVADGADKNHWV